MALQGERSKFLEIKWSTVLFPEGCGEKPWMVELNPTLQEATFACATCPLQSLLSSPCPRMGRNRFCQPGWTGRSSFLIRRARRGAMPSALWCAHKAMQYVISLMQLHLSPSWQRVSQGVTLQLPAPSAQLLLTAAWLQALLKLSRCCWSAGNYRKTVQNKGWVIKPPFPSWEGTHS